MKGSISAACEMQAALPATLAAVESFIKGFRRHRQSLPEPVDCFTAELLLREALTNAVLHGCHGDPSRQVRCVLRLKRGRLLIAIQDEGDGFNWRELRLASARFTACRGRGLGILRRYSDRLRYNDKGNLVTIVKTLQVRKES